MGTHFIQMNKENNAKNAAAVIGDDDDSIPPDPNQRLITEFTVPGVAPKFDPSKYPLPK